MIEVLVVIMILGLFNLLSNKNSIHNGVIKRANTYDVVSEVLNSKINSIKNIERVCLNNHNASLNKDVCFNSSGNVNQAITMTVINSDDAIVIHLGAGVYEVKRR